MGFGPTEGFYYMKMKICKTRINKSTEVYSGSIFFNRYLKPIIASETQYLLRFFKGTSQILVLHFFIRYNPIQGPKPLFASQSQYLLRHLEGTSYILVLHIFNRYNPIQGPKPIIASLSYYLLRYLEGTSQILVFLFFI